MRPTLPQLLVGFFIVSLAVQSETSSLHRDDLLAARVDGIVNGNRGTAGKEIRDEEIMEDSDFEDDFPEELVTLIDPHDQSIHSVMHLHQERGEVLIPCFGMWWPAGGGGGGGVAYDYGGDYYGDYKRKRRRSRKQKKAARTKKKKS